MLASVEFPFSKEPRCQSPETKDFGADELAVPTVTASTTIAQVTW